MKKISTLFALLFLVVNVIQAQQLNVFGGINSTNFKHKINGDAQDNSGTIHFNLGLDMYVPFKTSKDKTYEDTYGVFPTLQYLGKGTSKASLINGYSADIKVNYLQFNLPIGYNGGKYQIGLGPYAAYALSGTKKFRVGNGDKEKINFGTDLKSFDYGMGIEMKLSLFKIRYDYGIANLSAIAGNTVKTKNLSLSFEIPIVE